MSLPCGFDWARHRVQLQDQIVTKHGASFAVETIDALAGTAIAVRQVAA